MTTKTSARKKREDRLQVLLAAEERARLEVVAERLGLLPSTYARMRIIEGILADEKT